MQVNRLLHKFIKNTLPKIHKTRLRALIKVVDSLLNNSYLTLSSLGKNLSGDALVKNKIKLVDRLLSNKNLISEKKYIYKAFNARILNSITRAVVIVDWSSCSHGKKWIIQASLAASGRSIPLYQEIYPTKLLTNQKVENNFLKTLKQLFPDNLEVIIVTDAGFKVPWFKSVLKQGWHYVGRIRGNFHIKKSGLEWEKITNLYTYKKNIPKWIGKALLGKSNSIMSNFFIYKSKFKNRKSYSSKFVIASGGNQDKYSKSNSEPWVLATSIEGGNNIARMVINIYKSRMQIEQNFRDMKSHQYGFGFRYSRTMQTQRLEVLLIIGFISTIALWLLGIITEQNKLHYSFQSDTRKSRRCLSLISLALQVIKHGVRGNPRWKLKEGINAISRCCYDIAS